MFVQVADSCSRFTQIDEFGTRIDTQGRTLPSAASAFYWWSSTLCVALCPTRSASQMSKKHRVADGERSSSSQHPPVGVMASISIVTG